MRTRPKSSEIVEVYIDESSQNVHRYLVLGAVCVELEDSAALIDGITFARLPELPENEVSGARSL